ncbi:hypothetical protein DFH11DRAFT_1509673 [Phellopilus nigrolimitatus]|nr:hypothetical protein DFH11DRAFT_1509673 [Phellopilus nigrolimitatus]
MQSAQANNVNLDALQQLLAMQFPMAGAADALGQHQAQTQQPQPQPQHAPQQAGPPTLLEQQLRLNQLQQLQQLQNQIFQQQIELISGQSGQNSLSGSLDSTPSPAFRDHNPFHGLPTPANSTELRAQPPPNFVSPMILQNYMSLPGASQFASPNPIPQGSSSAPAHLAFHTHTPLPSPGDLDFDLSPLTSPWLGAYQHAEQPRAQSHQPQNHNQNQNQNQGQNQPAQVRPQRRGSKRGASSSGDDAAAGHARKRKSPAVRAAPSAGGIRARRTSSTRGCASLSSTPALRARERKNSTAAGDTPSPVDLSMPPPAPPPAQAGAPVEQPTEASEQQTSSSSPTGPTLSPVTPASIMNLGRLGLSSGLSSPTSPADGPQNTGPAAAAQAQDKGKGKAASKPSAPGPSGAGGAKPVSRRTSSASASSSLVSPPLKPLLPGGLAPSSAAHLATASNYTHHLAGHAAALHIQPGAALPAPAPAVRKTSHKAAEQKRRDSLKTSFDALRMLLPPLPLPSEDGFDGEPLLPGAMPPRGPPRGDAGGPNRAVSKLQLLRCGNDFIRRLKARLARRDEYIEQLKAEVRVLRARVAGGDAGADEALAADMQAVDLEKDLDAEEANAPSLGGPLFEGDEVDEEGGD